MHLIDLGMLSTEVKFLPFSKDYGDFPLVDRLRVHLCKRG